MGLEYRVHLTSLSVVLAKTIKILLSYFEVKLESDYTSRKLVIYGAFMSRQKLMVIPQKILLIGFSTKLR